MKVIESFDPCWDCVKGRHGICNGLDVDTGWTCQCPVPHDGNRRKPGLNGDGWFDAGEHALLADE